MKVNDKLLTINTSTIYEIWNHDKLEFVSQLTDQETIDKHKRLFPPVYHVVFPDGVPRGSSSAHALSSSVGAGAVLD